MRERTREAAIEQDLEEDVFVGRREDRSSNLCSGTSSQTVE